MSIPRTSPSASADVSPPRPDRSRSVRSRSVGTRPFRRRGIAVATALGLVVGAGALAAPAAQAA
ncbi:hypothetical protein, partial [Clavibacter phaseoli]|uniref:hypothetical protein n=1 Tax=Clavibacter phaseoli TaxID=1734031 RepID=UPI000EDA8BE9